MRAVSMHVHHAIVGVPCVNVVIGVVFGELHVVRFFFFLTNELRGVNTSNESTAERCKKKLPTTGSLMQAC